MRKRSLLYYIFIIIPFLITIGFSTWVVIYEFSFGPNQVEATLSSMFGTEQSKTYTGEVLLPDQLNGDPIDSSRISYEFKEEKASTFNIVTDTIGPINKGIYDVKIIVQNEGDSGSESYTLKFTVNPKKLYVGTSGTIELNYSDSLRSYADFVNNKQTYVKFYEEDGTTYSLYSGAYSVDCMHNGVYYYGTKDKIDTVNDLSTLSQPIYSDYMIGSTYLMNLTIKDDNYLVRDVVSKDYTLNPHILLKYKTAMVDGKLYTIEDAIKNQSSVITLAGYDGTTNKFVSTCFTKLTKEQGNPYASGYYSEETIDEVTYRKFTINSNNTLLIPYKNSTIEYEELDSTSVSANIYSNLIVPQGIHIYFTKSSKLYIGGVLAVQGRTSKPAVLLNHGLITMSSGSTLKSYGYLKGNGLVDVKSGATAYDIMIMHEWSGGNAATSLASSAFPVIAWTMHNISCPLKINKGGELRGYTAISVSILGYIPFDFTVIGGSSTEGECLFRPSATSSSNDYILKVGKSKTNDLNENIMISNKLSSQKDYVEMHGDYEDAQFTIKYSLYSFKTDTSICVPVSNMDIKLASGTYLNISKSSYVFMLGTSLQVDSEATANISNANAYVAFDRKTGDTGSTAMICPYFGGSSLASSTEDAKLILNGTLEGSGSVGGKAITSATGGQSTIDKYNVGSITIKDSQTTKTTLTFDGNGYHLYGLIGNSSSQSETKFVNGTSYITTTNDVNPNENSIYYFTTPENVKLFTIIFCGENKDINNPIKTVTKQVLFPINDEESAYNGQYIYRVSGKEYIPYKKYYTFSTWLQVSDNKEADKIVMVYSETGDNTIYLYPTFTITTFEFDYSIEYENSTTGITQTIVGHEDLLVSNQNTSFNYTAFNNSSLTINTTATFQDKVFYGWYLGYDESGVYLGNSFPISVLDNFIASNPDKTKIPLYAIFKDYEEYTINFIDNQNDLSFSAITNVANEDSINWPAMDYFKDAEQKYYCEGWYFNDTYSGTLASDFARFDANTFKLFANENNEINIYGNFIEKRSVIYKDGDKVLKSYYYLKTVDHPLANETQNVSYTYSEQFDGYTFENKWTDTNGNEYDSTTLKISDLTEYTTILTAKKTLISYTLTYSGTNLTVKVKRNGTNITTTSNMIIYFTDEIYVEVKGKTGLRGGDDVTATIKQNGIQIDSITGKGGGILFGSAGTANTTIKSITGNISITTS